MKSATYLSNLTALRGIAALLTVLFHVDKWFGYGGNFLVKMTDSSIIDRMYLMVDLFFILSGFIMMHVYGEWFSGSVKKVDFKKFLFARFARVYPLHIGTLFLMVATYWFSQNLGIPKMIVLEVCNNGYSILSNLLLVHSMNVHQWFTWNHASWSISVEWWTYMIFPFLVPFFSKLKPLSRLGIVFFCFLGYLFIMFYLIPLVTVPAEIPFAKPDPSKMTIGVGNQFGFLRCLFGFVIGMMLYYGYKEDWQKPVLSNGYLLSALILGFFLSCHLGLPDVISICFFPFILLSVAYGSSGANAFLNLKPLQKIGDWSFSIYLIHQPLMLICFNVFAYIRSAKVDAPPPKVEIWFAWLIGLGVVAVTLIVSSLTYRFWEVPTRRWLNPNYKSQ